MPLNDDNSDEYSGNENPKCPHCDNIYDIDLNNDYSLYAEDNHNVTCPKCQKDYSVTSRTKGWVFDTDEQ